MSIRILLADDHDLVRKGFRSLLQLTVKTVEGHRHNIMHKLDIHSVAELTKFAIREGLTPLDS